MDAVIESFHLLWDTFPERARLIHQSREVLAVNPAAAQAGLKVGDRCIDTPPPEGHKGCLAYQALKEAQGKFNLSQDGKRLRFWLPVQGHPALYVHFSVPLPDENPNL